MKRHLFYSHDGVGLGHTCRNLAIARALTELDPSATVLLATGTDDACRLGLPPRVEVLKLPSLCKLGNERYASRRLQVSPETIRAVRARLLRGVVEAFEPQVLLVDKHPLGAGGELREALEVARAGGTRTVLGLRDILDDPATVRAEWEPHGLAGRIAGLYDRVLVYGQQEVFDPIAAYGLPSEVQRRTVFCGYVTHPGAAGAGPGAGAGTGTGASAGGIAWARKARPRVLATVGGGEDGSRLLECFVEASRRAPWLSVAVTGPLAPTGPQAEFRERAREAGVAVHAFVPGLVEVFRGVGALVCMGGYNTLTEALSLGVPVVCVPRVKPRLEQRMRAEAFARMGLLRCVPPDALTSSELRTAILLALGESRLALARRCREQLEFDGAWRAARVLLQASGDAVADMPHPFPGAEPVVPSVLEPALP